MDRCSRIYNRRAPHSEFETAQPSSAPVAGVYDFGGNRPVTMAGSVRPQTPVWLPSQIGARFEDL